ncbi:MAG: hypothetical protein Q8P84_09300 [Deltaproteobacteria bacterium]|nr:hypothetical protein [Deltaproteobacteria bacterium]MDZ4224308.1 hypothetical protein [bacterium]
MKKIFFLFGFLVLSGCGGDAFNEGEDYGNLLDTPGGLTLNQSEHPLGWGDANCTICHNLENIHLVNRTGTSIDIVAIHDRAISEGISGCAACHGNNGVP